MNQNLCVWQLWPAFTHDGTAWPSYHQMKAHLFHVFSIQQSQKWEAETHPNKTLPFWATFSGLTCALSILIQLCSQSFFFCTNGYLVLTQFWILKGLSSFLRLWSVLPLLSTLDFGPKASTSLYVLAWCLCRQQDYSLCIASELTSRLGPFSQKLLKT